MIVRITGILEEVTEGSVILGCDYVDREVLVSSASIVQLADRRSEQITLYTVEYLEGSQSSGSMVPVMIGFASREDRAFFQHFITVKGIGPKKALRALAVPTGQIVSWIAQGNGAALAKLPGIGKKTAEMVVATLRDTCQKMAIDMGSQDTAAGPPVQRFAHDQEVALEILMAWGDSRHDAARWLEQAAQEAPTPTSADEWVRAAYRMKTRISTAS